MGDEHERTLAFANFAMERMRSLRQPVTPRNFEIWYVYAAAYNAPLNKVLNETISRSGRITEADLQLIYDTYLSPARNTERLDEVGNLVIGELDSIADVIKDALGLNAQLGKTLSSADETLDGQTSNADLHALLSELVSRTREMQEQNNHLEDRLLASRREIGGLRDKLEVIRTESMTDPLTGLSNRKSFDRAIVTAIAHAREQNEPLSVMMLDIDNFKSFNDTYGHLTGDQVLRLVGASLKQTVRGQDITARYGGEEFVVVLPGAGLNEACIVSESLRTAVMSRELKKRSTGEMLGRVTVSIGVSTLQPADELETLIERADNCLYAAKRGGRNRVVADALPMPRQDISSRVA